MTFKELEDYVFKNLEEINNMEPLKKRFFNIKDFEDIEVGKYIYLEYRGAPLLLIRYKKTVPYINSDFEQIQYMKMKGMNNPAVITGLGLLGIDGNETIIPKKAFYKLLLYYEYNSNLYKLEKIENPSKSITNKMKELIIKRNKLVKPQLLKCAGMFGVER